MVDANYELMIERACQAVLIADDKDPDEIIAGFPQWQFFAPNVRIVIASLREPNVHVTHAAKPYVKGYEDMRSAYEAWRAGIDAILAEPDPRPRGAAGEGGTP